MKFKCTKGECQVYGKVSTIQLFFRNNGELAYGRAMHYTSRVKGKPQFEYHPQNLDALKDLLKTQPISLTTEKATEGQVGQTKNGDLNAPENSLLISKASVGGIPQAWYGAGLLSLWSKGRVGSNPTSRAKLILLNGALLPVNSANIQ